MRCLLLLLATILAGSLHASADDAKEIRKLIPSESAMMRADFESFFTSNVPKASDVADKSLTLMLFAFMKVEEGQTPKQRDQFRYLLAGGSPPKPSDLAREVCRERRTGTRRIVLAPVTFIHEDRITECVCEVEGNVASGTVAFKVPQLYQGKVDYVARRIEGKWFITEFIMPAHGVHVVRSDDGRWKEKSGFLHGTDNQEQEGRTGEE